MDLDARAARAARELRTQVHQELDVTAARSSLGAAASARPSHLRHARVAALALVAVAVGAFAALGAPGGPGDGLRTGDPEETSGRAAAILGAMPSGPIDGKASWRLPVLAEPQNGLGDGDAITIYATGFEPGHSVGIVQCTSEADVGNAGIAACQLAATGEANGYGAVTRAVASSEGTVVAEFVVRRSITTPDGGEVDCASAPERCLVGIGAVSNYDQSGGAYIDFAAAPPFPEPTLALDPAGAVAAGAPATARLRAWPAGRAVRFSQCVGDRCQALVDAKAGPDGNVDQVLDLRTSIIDAGGAEVPCDGRCTLRARGIGPEADGDARASHAPQPPDLPLTFAEMVDTTPATTAPTTAPPTTAPPASTTVPATTSPPPTVAPTTTTAVPG
ncbi:MAG TPA: neocarzinostatin apoprotein domain-containing protein, partial [Aquihabitans sp.]|nr:neocarzinostatin apoprotein domain-containing protein [Aquihabitans sp.]